MYKLEAEERLGDITTNTIAYMDKSDSKRIIDSYKRQTEDITEVFEGSNDYSEIKKLKSMFNHGR